MQLVENNLNLADALGAVKAEMADLKGREEALKASLIDAAANGVCVTEGAMFRATVSFADKPCVSYAAAIAELAMLYDISEDQIGRVLKRHTKVAPQVPTVRVVARKG